LNKTNDLDKKYLTGVNKASFALAGFGQNLIIGFVNSYILFFYTDIFLIGAAPAGILMLVARFWDAANDPIMGTIVDKTRSKWGKMRPYIIFSSLPLALSTASLFIVPSGMGQTGRIVYAYVTYILWGMVYTVCDVPFWGLASSMTPNPKERIAFISTSRLVHSVGGVLPMVLVPLFVGMFGDEKAYTYAGITIGIFGSAFFTLAFFGTEERSQSKDKSPSLRECLSYLKINKPLRYVVAANVLGFMRALPVVAGMYIAVYVLGEQTVNIFGKSLTLNGAALNTALVAGWGVSGYVGMILTPKICEKLDYRQIYYVFATVGAVASLGLFFLPKTLLTVFLTLLICGMPYGVVANINYSMIADSVDYVEWKTGKRTEGVTVSFQTLMNKTMTALQTGSVSLMLMAIGFVQPIKEGNELITQAQTAKTVNGLILLITILPALGWIISMIPMRYYTFIGEERKIAHREIVERREKMQAQAGFDD
jgi:sugar (glycoside-pentoside-hexuronide) transporter